MTGARSRRSTIAPPITRVHKLFRIRTIVTKSLEYPYGVTDEDVGRILVNLNLSKPSILESKDKLKRARDHLFNASFLGLMIPIRVDRRLRYIVSPVGKLLSGYTFEDPCPRDSKEAAIFVDRALRMKLTNSYDKRRTYSDYRVRPLLSILAVLNTRTVHFAHIHFLLGEKRDLVLNEQALYNYLDIISQYSRSRSDSEVRKFLKDFNLDHPKIKKEITRSTKPLLDWLRQLNLIHIDENGWCTITDYGNIAFRRYSIMEPIWYQDLGFDAPTQAAILLVYLIAKDKKMKLDPDKLRGESRNALETLERSFKIFNNSKTRIVKNIDFDFYYDVPVEIRNQVLERILEIFEMLRIPYTRSQLIEDLSNLSLSTIKSLEPLLLNSNYDRQMMQLSKALGFQVPRREWFQTDFEWQVCLKLRQLNFPAQPYRGEFEGRTDLPIASDNPDILIRNRFLSLVECKSAKEWGRILKFNKKISGEILTYQLYAEDIGANSVLFVCEAEKVKDDFLTLFSRKLGNKANVIVICSWKFLEVACQQPNKRERLLNMVINPTSYTPEEKVLFNST